MQRRVVDLRWGQAPTEKCSCLTDHEPLCGSSWLGYALRGRGAESVGCKPQEGPLEAGGWKTVLVPPPKAGSRSP